MNDSPQTNPIQDRQTGFSNDAIVEGLDQVALGSTKVLAPYEYEDVVGPSPSMRHRVRMFCFDCNRQEGHVIYAESRFGYSFLIGFSFGLIFLIGPFQCQCCGARRYFRYDFLNARCWFQGVRFASKGASRRRKDGKSSRNAS